MNPNQPQNSTQTSSGINPVLLPGTNPPRRAGKKLFILLGGLLVIVGLGIAALYFWPRPSAPANSPLSKTTPTASPGASVKPSTAPVGTSAQAAQQTAKLALDYTVARNWPALYALFGSDVSKTTSQAQFIQLMSAPGSPEITAATLDGSGQPKVVGSYTYYSQPVTLTVRQTNGTTSTMHSSEYMILESGSWKLLSTDTPK